MNASYGPNGGLPTMHLDAIAAGNAITTRWDPCTYSPIHQDDINAQTEGLLDGASVPATVVNWAGDEGVSVQEWAVYMGELTGTDPVVNVVETPGTLRGSIASDAKRASFTGPCTVTWKDGIRRVWESRARLGVVTVVAMTTVLVTGSSSGIGEATALAFARTGATVGVCARREDRLADVVARCREHAPDSRMWVTDLSDLDAVDALASRAVDELGGVDVLVNNVGVPKRRKTTTLTPADVESVMAINYFGPVRLTLALLPGMVERGSGHIVSVSSMGAHMIAFGTGAYAASKGALELFTEALYLDLAGTGRARASRRARHHQDRVQPGA